MTNEQQLAGITKHLDEALRILTKEIPLPDIDVSEWNKTPIGRTVRCIENALDALEELP